jgi:molybdate transport system permease protein
MDWQALTVSLQLGAATLALLIPVAIVLGRILATQRFAGKGLIEGAVALPLVLPPTVLGFYLLVTFGSRSMLGRAFDAFAGQSLAFSF